MSETVNVDPPPTTVEEPINCEPSPIKPVKIPPDLNNHHQSDGSNENGDKESPPIDINELIEKIRNLELKLRESEENEAKSEKIKRLAVKLKKELASTKEELQISQLSESQSKEQLKCLTKEKEKISSLYQQSVLNFQNLQNEHDKLQDEYEQSKRDSKTAINDLGTSVGKLSRIKEELEETKHENTRLQNRITTLTAQISEHEKQRRELEGANIVLRSELNDERKKVSNNIGLEKSLEELRHQLDLKTTEMIDLETLLEDARAEISTLKDVKKDLQQVSDEKKKLEEKLKIVENDLSQCQCQIEAVKGQLEETKIKASQALAEKNAISSQWKTADETNQRRIRSLEEEKRKLEEMFQLSEDELRHKNDEFDAYKARVCKLLNERKENAVNDAETERLCQLENELIDVKKQLHDTQRQVSSISVIRHNLDEQVTLLSKERNELSSQLKKLEAISEENSRLKNLLKDLQRNLVAERDSAEQAANELCVKYEKTIENLKRECDQLRQEIAEREEQEPETLVPEDLGERDDKRDDDSINNLCNGYSDSPDGEVDSLGNHSSSIKRLSSCSSSLAYSTPNISSLNPLQHILNFDPSNDDVFKPSEETNKQIDGLQELLKESESHSALLAEQNRVLKDEIRRIQRSIERAENIENMEYLKNILVKFVSTSSDKVQLVPVLKALLKLNPQEEALFNGFASNSGSLFAAVKSPDKPPNVNGMTSKWSLWG